MQSKQNPDRVLGLGITCVDKVAFYDQPTQIYEKSSSPEHFTQCGGNMANTMVALSRLGVETQLMTVLGDDAEGKLIQNTLQKENVQTTYCEHYGQTSFAFIAVEKSSGKRTIFTCRGPTYQEQLNALFEENKGFQGKSLQFDINYNVIYVDGRFHKSALKLLQMAKQRNEQIKQNQQQQQLNNQEQIIIVVEAERLGLDVDKLIPYADIVKTSKRFSKEFFNSEDYKDNLKKLLKMGPRIAITTLEESGSIGIDRENQEEIIEVKKVDVNTIDKSGAGDAYSAGIIFGLLQKWPLLKIMQFSSYLAAKKCEKQGSQQGLLYLHEIKFEQ